MATLSLVKYAKNAQKKKRSILSFTIPAGITQKQFQQGLLLGYTQANSAIVSGFAIDTGTGGSITFSELLYIGNTQVSAGVGVNREFHIGYGNGSDYLRQWKRGNYFNYCKLGPVTTNMRAVGVTLHNAHGVLLAPGPSVINTSVEATINFDIASETLTLTGYNEMSANGPFKVTFFDPYNNAEMGALHIYAMTSAATTNGAKYKLDYTFTNADASGAAFPYYVEGVEPITVKGTPPVGISGKDIIVVLEIAEFNNTDGYTIGPTTTTIPLVDKDGNKCIEF